MFGTMSSAWWLLNRRRGGSGALIVPGGLSAPLTLSRAQLAGVEATAFANPWRTYGADVPRFVAPEGRLLIGGQRTNQVRNPRFEGATPGVIGSGGAAPTHAAISGGTGVVREVIGTGTLGGLPYIDIRWSVTSASTGGEIGFFPEAAPGYAITALTTHTLSVLWQIVGGSWSGLQVPSIMFNEYVAGAFSSQGSVAIATPTTAEVRAVATRTLTNASATSVMPYVRAGYSAGATFDVTVRFRLPQAELGSFASTPILPPSGTPGASTRGADILTAPLSSLGIAGNGACTVLWRGVFSATNIGDTQTIIGIDSGDDTSRYDLRLGTTGIPNLVRLVGSTPTSSAFGSTAVTPGATIRAGMAIDGAGRVAAVYDGFAGGAVQAITGGATSGLTTFRHGSSTFGNRVVWGETHTLTVLPRVLSDSDLQAAVAAL